MNSKKQAKKSYQKKRESLKKQNKKFEVNYNNNNNNRNLDEEDNNMDIDNDMVDAVVVDPSTINLNNLNNLNIPSLNTKGSNLDLKNLSEEYSYKVGKYWEKQELFSPVYTKDKVEIITNNILLSNIGNTIKILDGTTFENISINNNLGKFSENVNNTNKPKYAELNYDNEEITSFVFNHKNNHLICCMENSLIRIFEFENKENVEEKQKNEENFNSFNVNTKNADFMSNKSKNTLVKTIKLNKIVSKKMVIDSTQHFIAMLMSDKSIQVLETVNYSIISNFTGHKMFVNDIVFNPTKKSYVIYSGSEDGEIKVWDVILNK